MDTWTTPPAAPDLGARPAVLECRGLSKSYGEIGALNDVSLSLPRGRATGLLGPSGKTTLLKIAAGLLQLTAGSALVMGSVPGPQTKALVSTRLVADVEHVPDDFVPLHSGVMSLHAPVAFVRERYSAGLDDYFKGDVSMLGKLFKYDMKALSGVLLPLHAVVLAVSLAGCVAALAAYGASEYRYSSLDYVKTYEETPYPYGGYDEGYDEGYGEGRRDRRSSEIACQAALCDAIEAASDIGVLLCCLELAAAPLASLAVIVCRFYRNLFSDEGYLTLTLPATPGRLIASKVLSGALWLAMSLGAVLLGSLAISMAAVGFSDIDARDLLPYWFLSTLGGAESATSDGFYAVTGALNLALGGIEALMICYAAFSLGSRMAARHRAAASLGLVAGLWALVSLAKAFLGFAVRIWPGSGFFVPLVSALATGSGWAVSLAAIAVCWAVCASCIRRPNLP